MNELMKLQFSSTRMAYETILNAIYISNLKYVPKYKRIIKELQKDIDIIDEIDYTYYNSKKNYTVSDYLHELDYLGIDYE